jgi:hypothetical protein
MGTESTNCCNHGLRLSPPADWRGRHVRNKIKILARRVSASSGIVIPILTERWTGTRCLFMCVRSPWPSSDPIWGLEHWNKVAHIISYSESFCSSSCFYETFCYDRNETRSAHERLESSGFTFDAWNEEVKVHPAHTSVWLSFVLISRIASWWLAWL